MSIVGTAAIRPGYPHAEFSLTGRKYTVQWLVATNDLNDGPQVVQGAAGLPAAFSTYAIGNDVDIYARLREWKAWRLEDRSFQWIVEATYSTPEPKEGSREGNTGTGAGTHQDTAGDYTNPLIELPVVKTFTIEREVPIQQIFDINSGAIRVPANSACQVFSPPAMKKERSLAISISRNEDINAPHPALGVTYSGAVNSDYFWGLAPGVVQCQSITAERQVKQVQGGIQFAYLKAEYLFHCNPNTWDLKILDAGDYYCQSGATNSGSGSGASGSGSGVNYCPNCTTKIGFIDDKGHPIKGLLNGNGGKLAQGANPVYLTLRPYTWLAFAPLNLPQSFNGVQ